MKNTLSSVLLGLLLASGLCAAETNNRYIVRVSGGLPVVQRVCTLLGCKVVETIDGSVGQVFLVTDAMPPATFLKILLAGTGVVDAEVDLMGNVDSSYRVPPALYDSTPIDYYGITVPNGYVDQPASHIIHLGVTQKAFGIKGAGTVAVIDTGIDPNHPALKDSLVPGYDFTRNESGEGDETADIIWTTQPTANSSQAQWTNPNSAALVEQSTAAVVDGNPQYSDFGHGTMVSGLIHLAAPGAKLMPLKAFQANGTGYTSDILRATYWAVQHDANIINMSFNLPGYSLEMKLAANYATLNGLICIAAAGNQDSAAATYPAAYSNVIGVASTTNNDQRSSFSNYGQNTVWIAAPGEGVVTTYPFATYAAGWGTSFSCPFVSGVAALMLDDEGSLLMDIVVANNESEAAKSVAHAEAIKPALGNGILDAHQAVSAWRQARGTP